MAATSPLLDDKFQPAGKGSLDSRKRIALTRALEALRTVFGDDLKEIRFAIAYNRAGQILLSPEGTVPLHEVWLYKNKAVLASVLLGIEEAERGQVEEVGSFSKYANDEIE